MIYEITLEDLIKQIENETDHRYGRYWVYSITEKNNHYSLVSHSDLIDALRLEDRYIFNYVCYHEGQETQWDTTYFAFKEGDKIVCYTEQQFNANLLNKLDDEIMNFIPVMDDLTLLPEILQLS